MVDHETDCGTRESAYLLTGCSGVRGRGRLRRGRCVGVLRGWRTRASEGTAVAGIHLLPARGRTRLEVAEGGRGSAKDEN